MVLFTFPSCLAQQLNKCVLTNGRKVGRQERRSKGKKEGEKERGEEGGNILPSNHSDFTH